MKFERKKGGVIACIAALILIVLTLGFLYLRTITPGENNGNKSITVSVIQLDGTKKDFSYQTSRQYLGEVFADENLAQGTSGQYGLYIDTVDGVKADDSKEQWWCITKDGESVMTGADTTPIEDGDRFEITLMEGFE